MQVKVRAGVARKAMKIARKVTRRVWDEEKRKRKEKILFQSRKRAREERERRQVYDLGDGVKV